MAGFDQKSNVVLSDSKERVYSMEAGVEEIPLGLYLVKGDMMYVFFSQKSTLSPSDLRQVSSSVKSTTHWIKPLTLHLSVQNLCQRFDTSSATKFLKPLFASFR